MLKRREARKVRRAQLYERYERRKREREDAKRREAEETARAEAVQKQRERAAIKEAKRIKALRLEQAHLAKLHNNRRLMLWHGWRPWRCRVDLANLYREKADSFRDYIATRRC